MKAYWRSFFLRWSVKYAGDQNNCLSQNRFFCLFTAKIVWERQSGTRIAAAWNAAYLPFPITVDIRTPMGKVSVHYSFLMVIDSGPSSYLHIPKYLIATLLIRK